MRVDHVLTLVAGIGTRLDPTLVERLRRGCDGGEPTVLAPGEAVDIALDRPPALDALRPLLDGAPVDLLATPVAGRRKRLLVADMDGTTIENETLDELAERAGTGDAVRAITRRSMNGEIPFAEALRARVATLRGLALRAIDDTIFAVRPSPGVGALVATMREAGAFCALVSGGFSVFTGPVANRLGFHAHHANVLLDDGHALTGAVAEPILDRDAKRDTLRRLAVEEDVPLSATVAIGDGANDIAMLRAAGLGIAWRPKPVVAEAVVNRIEFADLRAVLFAQGFTGDEIRGAAP